MDMDIDANRLPEPNEMPPCQTYSMAGRRRLEGDSRTRGEADTSEDR